MGTTLQNGVYLPNEGERNCYAGLKTNWEILDQKVADVTALQQAVAGALHREIVESLPTTDIDPNTIYMILSGTSATENVYDEYMYVNNAWELIGTSATDLTNYYTKGDVDGLLLLKANASDLTSHTGDTTIHVTSADKSKWNTVALIKQLRLVNAQVGSATTIAFANIDDTNGIKVGDKCMDLDAKMFEITAVDTTNETVTVGTALIDLAQDSDVVHKSGNETVGGVKTFNDLQIIGYGTQYKGARDAYILPEFTAGYSGLSITTLGYAQSLKIGNFVLDANNKPSLDASKGYIQILTGENNGVNACVIEPKNSTSSSLGASANKWSKIYGTEYYYGSNNVEFSTKFVTTDTAQTIDGLKTFPKGLRIYNTNTSDNTSSITLRTSKVLRGSTTDGGDSLSVMFNDRGDSLLSSVRCTKVSNGTTQLRNIVNTTDTSDNIITCETQLSIAKNGDKSFIPSEDSQINLGSSSYRWKSFNGLVPSSLGMPSNTGYVDISSYFTNTGDGQTNSYTASANGWIYLNVTAKTLIMQIRDSNDNVVYADMCNRSSDGTIYMTIPIGSGNKLLTQWFTSSSVTITTARFIPCQGNI